MNAKLLLKTIFLLVVLFFLVLMGRENRGTVDFSLPPVLPNKITLPSAMMYFAFFAITLSPKAIEAAPQTPSFFFNISLTMPGLALPPVAFIT